MAKTLSQIRQARILNRADLEQFEILTGKTTSIKDLSHTYYNPARLDNPDINFIYIRGHFYPLPITDDEHTIVFTLIDQLMYEAKRHDWNDEPCTTLRLMIKRFQGRLFVDSKQHLADLLKREETRSRTYFGQYLSDDSDSENERTFQELERQKRNRKIARSKNDRKKFGDRKYKNRIRGHKEGNPVASELKQPGTKHLMIDRPRDFHQRRRRIQDDLKSINQRLENGFPLNDDFLNSLNFKYVVAQYRGIHYFTVSWDMVARRLHRTMDEIGTEQFSSAAFHMADVSSYHDLLVKLEEDPDLIDKLVAAGESIQSSLIRMMDTDPVTYNGYTFASLFHLLQYWYSLDYDGLPDRIEEDLSLDDDSYFKEYLQSKERPLFSTADTPFHSLLYAYGVKVYEGHEDERLRPRWRSDGRAERPYSGKVYVSLHPLSDYSSRLPSHLTSLFKHGLIPLNNLIVAERETSFLGYLPKDRTIRTHIAKYPSFKGEYKTVFEVRYGIDRNMYQLIKEGFAEHPPHSTARREIKCLLGKYLCAYQEVRLIRKAAKSATRRGEILIYRDEDGGFTLTPPDTPSTANNRLNRIVMAKRALYRLLAPNKVEEIETLDELTFEDQAESLDDDDYNCVSVTLFGLKGRYDPDHPEDLPIITKCTL